MKNNLQKIKNILIKHRVEILIFLVIITLCSLLRLTFSDWDQGHYLHPDERLYINASNLSFPKGISEFLSETSPLNPNMFYYGSFPLYLYKILYEPFFKGQNILFSSRTISALFSIATLPFIFLIGKNLFSKKVGYISSIIFTFSPGSIQHAHFNTTESILIFLISVITYFSIKFYQKKSLVIAITISIICALSYATKVTGLLFIIIPFLSFIGSVKSLSLKRIIVYLFFFVIFFSIFAFFGAPYNLLDWQQFYKEQSYMQGVILGKDKPPFTIIYETTIPYLSPIFQTAPFIFGFITFPLSIAGLVIILRNFLKDKIKKYKYTLILVFPIIYFIWAGSWYAKFARYYILLLPFVTIWAAVFIAKLPRKLIALTLLLIAINGLLFFRIYLNPHTRIAASYWIYENIPTGKVIATEHWDDGLPLPISGNTYPENAIQLPVYDPDSPAKIDILATSLNHSDYFIISSRRVYQSILNNEKLYPKTSNFYKKLFNGDLGFIKVTEFTNYPFFFSDDIADESFQSYDHPPVLVFENKAKLSKSDLTKILNE